MTTPGGSAPDGAYVVGSSFGSDITQQSAMGMATNGAMNSWDTAQKNMKSEFVSAQLVNGEVVRLDNRIDEIILGTDRAFLYTYSESGVWEKHPAAYKVVVDVLSGSTGGLGRAGGYSGGWDRVEFTGEDLASLPNLVAVTVGAGTAGGSSADAEPSSFGTFVIASGATQSNYGSGSRTYKMRGGEGGAAAGGMSDAMPGTAGSAGPFAPGGSGGRIGTSGGNGGHGLSANVGQIGPGSAGGGGAGAQGVFGSGGNGGHGGWPSAPGGGRGEPGGVAGNGAWGAVYVTVYVEDKLGSPPSTPLNLVASSVTSTSARVSWDASIDDIMVKNYVLYLNGTRYGVVMPTYNDFVGLTPGTQYAVRVQAVDMGDNASELSDPLLFTTLA